MRAYSFVWSYCRNFLALSFLFGGASAWAFSFTNQDVIAGFRIISGGEYEMEVNLGQASNYYNLPYGTVLPITNYTAASVSNAFGGSYSSVTWSVFACVDTFADVTSGPTNATVWMTRSRANKLAFESKPWVPHNPNSGLVDSHMDGTGDAAEQYSGLQPLDPVMNSATTVIFPAGNALGYAKEIGPLGNFENVWQGDIETTSPADTTPTPWAARADFFQVTPNDPNTDSGGVTTFLGYFDFGSDGTLTYHTALGPAPTVLSVSPAFGSTNGGTPVTITGSNFLSGSSIVEFGGLIASNVQFVNATTLTAVAPPFAAALDVSVAVFNPDGQSGTQQNLFQYQGPAPVVAGIAPTYGSVAGGDLVALTGTNFGDGASVFFGGVLATSVNYSNSALITVVAPPAAGSGAVNVTLVNPDGQSNTLTLGFDYTNGVTQPPPPPVITSIFPTNGPVAGGTLVTLNGTNFAAGSSVFFGGILASSVNYSNSAVVTVLTPPAPAAGPVNVTLARPDGQSNILALAFDYTNSVVVPPAPPVITSLTAVGNALVLVTAGATNGSSVVLTATNLTLPLSSWAPVATNAVDGSGLFTNTIPIDAWEAQRFFLISTP